MEPLGGRLVGKRTSYEGLAGRIVDKLGEDRIEYIDGLSEHEAQSMVDQHQLRALRARRKSQVGARKARKFTAIR